MRIFIRASQGWSGEALALLRKRLEFALGRFSGRLGSLTVRVKDVNGPRGGQDKQCLITARLDDPRRVIVIEDVDVDPAAAMSRAVARTARAVSRAVDASGGWRRLQRGHT